MMSAVKKLLADGYSPNEDSWGDDSVLIQAAEYGHLEVIQALIEAGADPKHMVKRTQKDALVIAARWGGYLQLEVLLHDRFGH